MQICRKGATNASNGSAKATGAPRTYPMQYGMPFLLGDFEAMVIQSRV